MNDLDNNVGCLSGCLGIFFVILGIAALLVAFIFVLHYFAVL